MKKSVKVEDVVDLLNEYLKLDPKGAELLVSTRIPCNEKITDHPTIQTFYLTVGLIDFLNGLFGIGKKGSGPIVACFNEQGNLFTFKQIGDVDLD